MTISAFDGAQRLHRAERQAHWLAADSEAVEAIMSEADGSPWVTIARVVRRLAGASTAAVWLPIEGNSSVMGLGLAAYDGGVPDAASRVLMTDAALYQRLLIGREPMITSLPGSSMTVLVVPLLATDCMLGLLTLPVEEGTGELRCVAEQVLIAAFCGRSALAHQLIETQRGKPKNAVDDDRLRIAGDLNDHVVKQLFRAGLELAGAATQSAEPAVQMRIEAAIERLDETIRQIRRTVFDLAGQQHRVPQDRPHEHPQPADVAQHILDEAVPRARYTNA